MRRRYLGFLLLLLMAGRVNGDEAADKAAKLKAELARLQGTWQLVQAETDGKPTPKDVVEKIRVIIKGSTHSVYFGPNAAVKDVAFAIDPQVEPHKTEDTLAGGHKIRGIYKIEGDTMTSCVGKVDAPWPNAFTAAAGTGQTLRVFKKVP